MTSTSSACEWRGGEKVGPPLRTPISELVERTGRIAGKNRRKLELISS